MEAKKYINMNRFLMIINDIVGLVGLTSFLGAMAATIHDWAPIAIQLSTLAFFILINHRGITTGAEDIYHKIFKCKKNKNDESDTK